MDLQPSCLHPAVAPQGEAGQASWPFGQCPVYQDGDFRLGQSDAILRYIARQHGLYGSGIKEESLIDSFLQGVEDLRKCAARLARTHRLSLLPAAVRRGRSACLIRCRNAAIALLFVFAAGSTSG